MKTRELRITQFAILSLLLIGIVLASSTSAEAQRRRSWDGYPNWGGSYELRQTALNAGYNEGSNEGRNDRARGRQRNYQDFSAYQKATKDFSSRLGDRELYRRYFREAFQPPQRNFLIFGGWAYRRVDIKLRKDFPEIRGTRLGVSVDVFNVFNFMNFTEYALIVPPAGKTWSLGQPTQVLSDPRRIQVGVEYNF